MDAQLNVESEDAYRLACHLSELTGERLTAVVTKALQAVLERQERQGDVDLKVERMVEIGRKKRHPAQLNFGDCMVYGVAKAEREPLLFKGAHLASGDFSQTDIEPALKD